MTRKMARSNLLTWGDRRARGNRIAKATFRRSNGAATREGTCRAIRRVRQGVQDGDFGSTEGMLSFPRAKHVLLSRDVKATVYGGDGRFRIWVQCRRDDVYVLADLIWQRNG